MASKGYLTPLADDTQKWLLDNYAAGQSWVDLSTYKGKDGNAALYAFPYKIDVKSLVANGGLVMMEGVENYIIGGKPFHLETIGAFDINLDGLITRWRYSYDLTRLKDQMKAAGFNAPT